MVILGKDTYATEHLVDDQASAILMEWLSKHMFYLFQHLPSYPGDPHHASYTSGTFMHPNWPSPKIMVMKMFSEDVLVDRQNVPSKAKESEDNRNVTSK